ncbi:MAG: hypothetical protein HY291_16065 [Planctomycetes bacterium]|nr:hypothetical protein [Planctomycetota bacterium]
MRHDTVIWAPRRAKLKEFEQALSSACHATFQRTTAIITPLFHSAPEHRQMTPQPHRLRLITLENGDYQQIHNPSDETFDQLFDEWPRVIVQYKVAPLDLFAGGGDRQALLECHDLDTNWDKAGWTSGTTMIHQDARKDRPKVLFGFYPYGWPDAATLEKALAAAAFSLAKMLGGKWSFFDPAVGGHQSMLRGFFERQGKPQEHEIDPLHEIRSIEDTDVGRI